MSEHITRVPDPTDCPYPVAMHESDAPWAPPAGSPAGTSGWYLASDGEWYRTDHPPAAGYALADDGRWRPSDRVVEPWRSSRWGLGDAWWGVLAYVGAGLVGAMLLAVVSGDIDSVDDTGPYALGAFVALNAVAAIGVLWLATSRKGLRSLRADFGLTGRWLDALIGIGLGIAGVVTAGLVSYAIDSALGADERTSNLPVDELASASEFIVFFAAVAIVTPIVEELFFRGLIYRSILKRGRSAPRAITATTVLFVVPHLPAAESWTEVAGLFGAIGALGLAFNLACHWTGNRLAAPIVAHMFVNGLAAVALYVG